MSSLTTSSLAEWCGEPRVLSHGIIMICRSGEAVLRVNFKEWRLLPEYVITLFPGDVVHLSSDDHFQVEMLQYSAELLREASLQLEQTVYSSLREDRCRQDTPVVTGIINSMFALLRIYFSQPECTCLDQLVLFQLKAFFIGFHEYITRNPLKADDDGVSRRVRTLFNQFMALVERDYKLSRDVAYYASQLNITPKYLTNIVRQVTPHTPKVIIDHYVTLQLKMQLHMSKRSIKEIAWEYHFSDASFFCRYFKHHTGMAPKDFRAR